jgi:hypothetical protein
MTDLEELQEEILLFIKNKREELNLEVDEFTMPFIKTLAEPENEDDEEYAQKELDDALSDKGDCDELLNELEKYLTENSKTPSKNHKGHA